MLKKLVMEFKDELDALGVKVDTIDKRVAVLEDRLGGWKFSGQMYFDAKLTDKDNGFYGVDGDKSFGFGRARLVINKFIDENTVLTIRNNSHKDKAWTWDRWYVDTKLPYDINFRFGRFNFDWEGDNGLYNAMDINNDATFGDFDVDGFQFNKTWGIVTANAVVGRNTGAGKDFDGTTGATGVVTDTNTHMMYALNLHANFNEKFRGGLMGYWWNSDNEKAKAYVAGVDVNTYGVYAGFDFTPAVTLQGVYYWQDLSIDGIGGFDGDSPKSWKAQLYIKQDLLKFTSLWLEYAQEDNSFFGTADYSDSSYGYIGSNPYSKRPWNSNTAKMFLARADQKWNDKWSTYVRYFNADWDTNGYDDTREWSVGAAYQYTPAIQFKLEYADLDFGKVNNVETGSDHLFRFRTTVNF